MFISQQTYGRFFKILIVLLILVLTTACASFPTVTIITPIAITIIPSPEAIATVTSIPTPKATATLTPLPTPKATATLTPPPTPKATATLTPLPIPKATATLTPRPSPTQTAIGDNKPGYKLIFSDEFDETRVDTRKWNTRYWFGRTNQGNKEAQYYEDDAFEFTGSYLRIRAEKRSSHNYAYTSGILSSHDKFAFTYGYLEARARVPKGAALWPAIWLLPARKESLPEIDVLEIIGQEPSTNKMSLHYLDEENQAQKDSTDFTESDFSADFHLFAIQWSKDELIWFIDGVERHRVIHNIPQEPMYILINLAVGGDWLGYPDKTTPFPSYFDVDYMRVFAVK